MLLEETVMLSRRVARKCNAGNLDGINEGSPINGNAGNLLDRINAGILVNSNTGNLNCMN